MNKSLLTEYQVAESLSVTASTLRRWRWEGRGPNFIKIGRAVRYDPIEIDNFIVKNRRTSTSDFGE